MPTYEVNNASKITIYKQPNKTGCAATCAAMCVRKSPETLEKDGFDISYVHSWDAIAQRYGYEAFKNVVADSDEKKALLQVVDLLVKGYPVIAKINDDTTWPHWVVITTYSGNTADISKSQFTCADPISGTFTGLRNTRYTGIYTIKYLYPQK